MSNMLNNLIFAPSKTNVKIVLIGDGATGKTSYFDRMVSGNLNNYKFCKNYNATYACNVCQIEFKIYDHKIKIHLFDTAGQEKFGKLRDSYLMGADGIILMYDVTQKETNEHIVTKWIPEIKNILLSSGKTNVPVMIVGNKNDKIGKKNEMCQLTLNEIYGIYNGPIDHCTISVKSDDNMMKPLNWLLKKILSYLFPIHAKKNIDSSNEHTHVYREK